MKIWNRLDERYGAPELVVASLKRNLYTFPTISYKHHNGLYELSDLLTEVESAMSNEEYKTVLSYFDSSTSVNPIVQKLPYHVQNKWVGRANEYMKQHHVIFPHFKIFCEFVHEMSSILNNPSFIFEPVKQNPKSCNFKDNSKKSTVRSFKTEVNSQRSQGTEDKTVKELCAYHNTKGHTINQCKTFKNKRFNVRK